MAHGNCHIISNIYKALPAALRRILTLTPVIFLFTVNNLYATELKIECKDKDGKQVRLSKAKLLLTAWGYTKEIPLRTSGSELILQLDAEWLKSRAPERFHDMNDVYLYMEAAGYASIRSERFRWMGTDYDHKNETTISFHGGRKVKIASGTSVTMEAIFRKPVKRYIRLVDDDNKPFPGVKITSSMFWSHLNHCGHLSGAYPLGTTASDAAGRIEVIDGDFEYVFEIEDFFGKPVFKKTDDGSFPRRLVTYLNNEETTIQLHRLKLKTLELRIKREGRPLTGAYLGGCSSDCPCGGYACCGPFSTTVSDRDGIIKLPEFYPERISDIFIYLIDEKNMGISEVKRLWELKPEQLPESGIIDINLPGELKAR